MLIETHFDGGDKGILAYGLENRLRLLQEELCECGVEVNHYFRNREGAREHLTEEIADVILMISEVWPEFGNEVDAWLKQKSLRCMNRIEARLRKNMERQDG